VVMNDQFDWYMGQRVAPELGAVELVGRGISVPGELLRYDLQQLQWQGIEGGWLGRERALDGSGPGLALWVLLVAGLAAIHGMGRATAETGTLRRALPLLAYGLVPLLAYGVAAEEFRGAKAFLAAGALLAVILGEAAAVVGRHRVAVALLWILLAAPLVAVLPRVVTRHPGYETREAVAWLEQRRGPIEVPAAGERVEPVVVHMGHMYCPVAYYAVPGVELCDWPTQNRWPPDAPHAELRSVFIAIDYTVGVPHHEAASYTIEFEQVFEGALSGAESFWLVLSEDRVFADPDRSRLRPWLQPYRVIDGRLFHGLEVYRLCRRGVAWCDRMEPPSELPPIIP